MPVTCRQVFSWKLWDEISSKGSDLVLELLESVQISKKSWREHATRQEKNPLLRGALVHIWDHTPKHWTMEMETISNTWWWPYRPHVRLSNERLFRLQLLLLPHITLHCAVTPTCWPTPPRGQSNVSQSIGTLATARTRMIRQASNTRGLPLGHGGRRMQWYTHLNPAQ
jgi:hypothetical protein